MLITQILNIIPRTGWLHIAIPVVMLSGKISVAQPMTSSGKETTKEVTLTNGSSFRTYESFLIEKPEVKAASRLVLDELYNFEFDSVSVWINYFSDNYPWHPLSYFLSSLSNWWRIIGNPMESTWDEAFITNIDKAIEIAIELYKDPQYKSEASFFASAAYGLRSQFYMERKKYAKSAFSGKKSLHFLNDFKDKEDLSYELLFGQGLYNYYSVWIPENYPFLKSIIWLFPQGNKELGKMQLLEVYTKATYTRIEAAYYLIEILNRGDASDKKEAKEILETLIRKFPNNSYFLMKYDEIFRQKKFSDNNNSTGY